MFIERLPTLFEREAVLSDTRVARGETALLAIGSLHDVEEDIWSPTYGLRGKLDASVQANIERTQRTLSTHPAPFEIKTGRAVAGLEHRAQTMLYSLLMQDRYGQPVGLGLLYYTQSEEVISVPATRSELRALIGVRNVIAEWMARRFRGSGQTALKDVAPFLPPTINSEQLCGRCYALDACMLYRRVCSLLTREVWDDDNVDRPWKMSPMRPRRSRIFTQRKQGTSVNRTRISSKHGSDSLLLKSGT